MPTLAQLGILFAGYAGGLLLFTPVLGILSDKCVTYTRVPVSGAIHLFLFRELVGSPNTNTGLDGNGRCWPASWG